MFRFIEAEKANHAVSTMCRVLEVSRSGYYAWSSRPPSERAVANAALIGEIRRVHADSDGTYGSRRVHAELRRDGHRVNLKRVERLMRVERIQGAYVPAKRRRGGGDGVLGVDGVEGLAGPGQARLPAGRSERVVVLGSEADSDRRGGAAPGQRVGLLQPADRRLGDGPGRRRAAGCRRAADGCLPAPAGRGDRPSCRSRLSARAQPVLATVPVDVTVLLANDGLGKVRW